MLMLPDFLQLLAGLAIALSFCISIKFFVDSIAVKAAGFSSFPQSTLSSVLQYFRSFREEPMASQARLVALSCASNPALQYTQASVNLKGQNRCINELVVEPLISGSARFVDLVLLHGFGAGLGFFFANLPIADQKLKNGQRIRIHAIDWLGMGLSSRPKFKVSAGPNAPDERQWVENYFIDQLEEYLEVKSLTRVIIVAHSFGAYMAVRFAQKYPKRLVKLILISPVAINHSPYKRTMTSDMSPGPACSNQDCRAFKKQEELRNPLPAFIVWLWDHHFTPFDFVRFGTFLGPKFISAWTYTLQISGLVRLSEQDVLAHLHDYTYRIFSAKASSERALPYILEAGAHAREGLMYVLPTHIPLTMIYGERDWMPVDAGHEAAKFCNENGGHCRVHVLKDAGHHCYLEQALAFNELLIERLN